MWNYRKEHGYGIEVIFNVWKDIDCEINDGKILYLELGVGYNTPGIIKYPFWQMTADNPYATYVCVNFGEAVCPENIRGQAICIDGDIGTVIGKQILSA